MRTLRAWRVTAALAFRAWPAGALGRMAVTIIDSLCAGLLPGLALRGVVNGGGVWWMVLLVAAGLVPLVNGVLWEVFQRGLMVRTEQAAAQAIMAAALAPPGIEHLEVPRYADAMEAVRDNTRTPALLFDWMATFIAGLVGIAVGMVALVAVNPLLVVPVAGAAGLGVIQAATRRRALVYIDQSLPGQRLTRRLADLATTAGAAKEVRMLGMGRWLIAAHRREADQVGRRLVAGERRPVLASALAGVAQALLFGLGLAWLVRLVATGRATTGDLALGIVVLYSTVERASNLGMAVGADLARNTHTARRYLWLLDYQPELAAPADPRPVPESLTSGIALDHVSFSYPGSGHPALADVSLIIPAGATVALVGDNGAGKSTLVKLLCRFYDPDNGRISIDGVDLRDLDPAQWLAASTGAFQDFMRFRFLARESVGVGDASWIDDNQRVATAARQGGAAVFLEQLPDGYETQLGRDFPGGSDLSEGQWQKVALSRSLMRPKPFVLILDEPTAALDARAEHQLFEYYAAQAAVTRDCGGITLLVSHRFSTVRMADLIVVLQHGRIVETGSHNQLTANGGSYAEMYNLQAGRYQ